MIVCICANVNENKIRQAIADGADTRKKLVKKLGVCSRCCVCREQINLLTSYPNFSTM